VPVGTVNKRYCERYGFLLNGVGTAEIGVAEKMNSTSVYLGNIVKNQRGATMQKFISNEPVKDCLEVIGGKQVVRYAANGIKGYIPKAVLHHQAQLAPNAIIVQNIVAHIRNPIDHIKIIATIPDRRSYAILDTVNQLTNTSSLSSEFILGVLNSKLMSWYAYRFDH